MTQPAAIPVLVVPPVLRFTDDASGHKQIITVYNPMSCVLHFKILSTKPDSYVVVPSSGKLKPQSSIDVVVRLTGTEHVTSKHKFLVKVFDDHMTVAGDQIVRVAFGRAAASSASKAHLESLTKMRKDSLRDKQKKIADARARNRGGLWNLSPFVMGMVFVALLASWETAAFDVTSKMFIAYLIGICTMAFQYADR
eukprot:CAMPEP_0167786790 /NCGR_PEP_ID=MMETSP0111_2-20121227/9022_1 /TAXON_ID=91324 /ORGANISM="Lotharella globosa, Strain CCCM811" /LENGTH=195 /DNA_ID=CAMNT_0007678279 /DNA_START=33 /DNA_END=620 /DNA_ORIENTATION=+